MNFHAIPNFLAAILILITGSVATLKNRESRVNFLFFLLTLSAFIWQLGTGFAMSAKNPFSALIATRVAFLGIALIPIFSYHLSLSISDSPTNKLLNIGYIFALLFFIPLSWTPLVLNGVYTYTWGFFFKAGQLHPVFMVFFIYYMVLVFLNLFWSFRKETKPLEKNRKKYLLIALFIAYIGSVDYLPTYGIEVYPFGYLTLICFVLIFAYAILRFQIMDINIALTRAGIFIIVYALVLGIPFWFGIKFLGIGPWIFPVSIMAVFATSGPFIYQHLRKRAEEVLLKEQRRYQKAISGLTEKISGIRILNELLNTETSTIAKEVQVSFCAVYLKEDDYNSFQRKSVYPAEAKSGFPEFITYSDSLVYNLNTHGKPISGEEVGKHEKINFASGLVVPCFGKEGLLAIIILGAKPNHTMYTENDIFTFNNLSYATSLAIENCTYWKEIEDRQRKARLQEMDTFSYSLAHEIDNPMTFVRNLARFLKEHFLKYITEPEERKEVEEMCNIIMEGSERVMGMVKAIRQFGQKTTGEFETLNLQETIEGFFKLYAPELKANFIIFTKEMPKEVIYVKGVVAELQQVLIIFAKNAIHAMKYSQEKKISLKVTELNHSTVRIGLSDTGYGIKKENLETIFAPFFTSKASTEGTGMGLHNAKGFILRHQGRIWAESEGEGKGATFIFELPIVTDVKPEDFKKKDSKTDWVY